MNTFFGWTTYNGPKSATRGFYGPGSTKGIIFIQDYAGAIAENGYWSVRYPDLWDWLLHKPEQIYYVLRRDGDEEYLFIRAYPLRE